MGHGPNMVQLNFQVISAKNFKNFKNPNVSLKWVFEIFEIFGRNDLKIQLDHVWTMRGPSFANVKDKGGQRRGHLAPRVTAVHPHLPPLRCADAWIWSICQEVCKEGPIAQWLEHPPQRKVPGSNPGWVITFQRFLCIWVSALCGCTHVWCKFHEEENRPEFFSKN